MARIVSFEGTTSGEMGGVPGESTPDSSGFCNDFEVETPGTFIGGGGIGLLQRIYIEANTGGQALNVFINMDGVETQFGTIAPATKTVSEKACELTGYIASVRLASVSPLTSRIEISAIELDFYVPDHMD
jgi:hypothetical protein